MRTIEIRDVDAADGQITEMTEPRSRINSVIEKNNSLRNVKTIDVRFLNDRVTQQQQEDPFMHDFIIMSSDISEMPAVHYESFIVESLSLASNDVEDINETSVDSTNRHSYFNFDDSAYNQSHQSNNAAPLELPAHSFYEEPLQRPSEPLPHHKS